MAVDLEPFDSEVFGRTIGRVVAVDPASSATFDALLRELIVAARDFGFGQLLRRVDTGERPEVWALHHAGFELMDIGVTFSRPPSGSTAAPRGEGVVVRAATQPDVEAIAGDDTLTWASRYESDPTYSPAQLRDLRRRWIWNSFHARADAFLVAEVDGRVGSFATCIVDPRSRHGDIDLVATLPAFRGRGLAPLVVDHAVAWFSDRADLVSVRTQATNVVAARVYEKAGFTMSSSDLTLRLNLGPDRRRT